MSVHIKHVICVKIKTRIQTPIRDEDETISFNAKRGGITRERPVYKSRYYAGWMME